MKIDIHTHCAERSSCSHLPEKELIEEAIASGLDALVISDHHRYVGDEHLAQLRREYGRDILLFSAIEMTFPKRGAYEGEDILLIGVHEPRLETQTYWTYEEIYDLCRQRNGFCSLCHALRYHDGIAADIYTRTPDAIEIHSSNIGACDSAELASIAKKLNRPVIQCSDAHYNGTVGLFHIDLNKSITCEEELVAVLKAGDYSLCEFPEKVSAFREKIEAREKLIRQYIQNGWDAEKYSADTGLWTGYYDRVKRGKSYVV